MEDQVPRYSDCIECWVKDKKITNLTAQNKSLRKKVKKYKEAELGIDKCEGCKKIATYYDYQGTPLCDECFAELEYDTIATDGGLHV
jgi:hypothetical protein